MRIAERFFNVTSTSFVWLSLVMLVNMAIASTLHGGDPLVASVQKETLWRNRDGQGITWFHPRACVVPVGEGKTGVLMTMQDVGGSDYFGPVHWTLSTDEGRSWTEPKLIPAFSRQAVAGRADGLKAGVCDVVPQYHAATNTVLAMGHVVFYKGDYFARKEQLPRYPVYSVRGADGEWSARHILQWDDPRKGYIYTNNCGQRIWNDKGDLQLAFSFGDKVENRLVCGIHAAYDGRTVKVRRQGKELEIGQGRGLLEPSVTRFGDQVWMTMRAEDGRGYWTRCPDGLDWQPMQAWTWDDGEPLGMSTTQQHWLTHSDGLFLVYTRRDTTNENVIRWRSPLWMARVDAETGRLIKATEQVVLPLVGDGVKSPREVALMGNFHVVNVSPHESWVTVGEVLVGSYRGDLLIARVRWTKPNRLPLW